MRIRLRAFLSSSLLLSLVAGTFCPPAGAIGVTSSFTESFGGTVTGGTDLPTSPDPVAASDPISGSFTLTTPETGTGVYQMAGEVANLQFTITNGTGSKTTYFTDLYSKGAQYTITITKVGTGGADMVIYALTQGSSDYKADAYVQLTLYSSTYYSQYGDALPNATTIASFLTSPAQFLWDPGGSSINGSLNSFNGQSVPEPSSLALGLIALAATGTAGFLISRRKGNAVSQAFRQARSPRR